jgi:hypothetical protein
VEAPPVEPVNKNRMEEYMTMKDSLMTELRKINWEQQEELLVKDYDSEKQSIDN